MNYDNQNLVDIGEVQEPEVDTETLSPHSYPVWVNLIALFTIALFLYSTSLLPQLLRGASLVRAAQISFKNGDYLSTKRNYAAVLKEFPNSRTAHIGSVKAEFMDENFGDYQKGLSHLMSVADGLSDEEWKNIKKTMPQELQDYFTDKGS